MGLSLSLGFQELPQKATHCCPGIASSCLFLEETLKPNDTWFYVCLWHGVPGAVHCPACDSTKPNSFVTASQPSRARFKKNKQTNNKKKKKTGEKEKGSSVPAFASG